MDGYISWCDPTDGGEKDNGPHTPPLETSHPCLVPQRRPHSFCAQSNMSNVNYIPRLLLLSRAYTIRHERNSCHSAMRLCLGPELPSCTAASYHAKCMPLLFFLRHLFPPLRHNLVHNPKFYSFLRRHEIVPFQCLFEPIQCSGPLFSRSSTMLRVNVGKGRTDTQDLFGMQSDIGCLALRTSRWFYRDIQRLDP